MGDKAGARKEYQILLGIDRKTAERLWQVIETK